MMGPLLSGFIKKHLADRASSMIAIYSMALALGAALGACGPLLTGVLHDRTGHFNEGIQQSQNRVWLGA